MLTYNEYCSKVLELGKYLVTDERIKDDISVVISFSQSGMSPVASFHLKSKFGKKAILSKIESDIEFWQHEDDIIYICASAGFIDPTGTPIFLIISEWFKCIDVDDAKAVVEKVIKLYE